MLTLFLFIKDDFGKNNRVTSINFGDTNSLGDLNSDGKINAVDYILIRKYLLNMISLTDNQKKIADLNSDGKISVVDYIYLRKIIIGIIPAPTIAPIPTVTPTSNPTPKTVKEKIQTAYSQASNNKKITLNNFKTELNKVFGSGYSIIDNGVSWLIEVPSEKAIEIINQNGTFEKYITPEKDCGAKGDGVTNDTDALKKCMQSSEKNLVLTGTYLVKDTITSSVEKNIFKGKILCQLGSGGRAFRFNNIVRINNTTFTSSVITTGVSPHSETYTNTSNIDFVEIWGKEARITDCVFENALRAIRGRISTGATTVPDKLYVSNSNFIDCKAPIQGYFAYTNVDSTNFTNNGDLYSGDHAIYIESFGSKELNVNNCTVTAYNSESGLAFQIYGKKSDQTNIPRINISNCTIKANGIVSSDLANVTITNTNLISQHKKRFVTNIENGSVVMDNCNITHDYFIPSYSNVSVTAKNSTFKLNANAGRAYFPTDSTNCRFINWGGRVIYPNTTVTNSVFTRDLDHVIGKYYIGIGADQSILINNSSFKAGDNISYNSPGKIHLKNCHYINNIGINVTNVIEEGTIKEDIVK